jgi:ABC-2 type transport system permease protein
MMSHIRTIIDKEWSEVFKNRMVIFTIILMPLLFTALPLVMLGVMGGVTGEMEGAVADVPQGFLPACDGLRAGDCMQIYLVNEFLILFMLMPVIIPVTIAAYSIVGEKTTRSLEPLLATPITTVELLAGKSLAAAIPAILASWVSFGLFLILLPVIGVSKGVISYIAGPTWLLAVLVIGPLMSIAAVNFAIYVSSRVNDPRVAEQISAVIIVPIMLILFAQLAGLITINVTFMIIAIIVLALIDVGMMYLGASIFDRESILTRWK